MTTNQDDPMPFSWIHSHHGNIVPPQPRATAATEQTTTEINEPSNDPEVVREEIIAELEQEQALDRFRDERPDLWLQSQRVSRIMEIQSHCDDECFPSGSCFMHANLPAYTSFCVKQILEIDLENCTVTCEIFGDGELEEGIVIIPLETISWFGFPSNAISVNVTFQGFTKLHAAREKAAQEKKAAVLVDKDKDKDNSENKISNDNEKPTTDDSNINK